MGGEFWCTDLWLIFLRLLPRRQISSCSACGLPCGFLFVNTLGVLVIADHVVGCRAGIPPVTGSLRGSCAMTRTAASPGCGYDVPAAT